MSQKNLLTILIAGAVAFAAYKVYQDQTKSSIEMFSDRFGRGFPFN